MSFASQRFTAVFLSFFILSLIGIGFIADNADARSRSGGRSFSSSPSVRPPAQSPPPGGYASPQNPNRNSGFMRGLAGGLVGGAIGSMLFGSLAHGGEGGGIGGSGIGLLQILLFAGAGYFIYSRFFRSRPASPYAHTHQSGLGSEGFGYMSSTDAGNVAHGLEAIRRTDPTFDPEHFKEVAQDIFFQVQAGWMRRDLHSYRHLLGERLAREYEGHFEELHQKGQINKLESIAIRKVEMVNAGTDSKEDFVTLLFTANLLDYTVDERSNEVVDGSMTQPVKFAEQWTWARPVGTLDWKLEGIEVVNG
jgi:predicted lipid-binding transport protein (Tim44 family)